MTKIRSELTRLPPSWDVPLPEEGPVTSAVANSPPAALSSPYQPKTIADPQRLGVSGPQPVQHTQAIPPLGSGFRFGAQWPQGEAAVQYITGPEGTWRPVEGIVRNPYSYYAASASEARPFDTNAAIDFAQTHRTSSPDANGHLLFDGNNDGDIDGKPTGFAFIEHAGRGVDGAQNGSEFQQYWVDDNWLARYMTQAYQRPDPAGLTDPKGFSRWKVLGGDITNWAPYNTGTPDALALDGMYHLIQGDSAMAVAKFKQLTWGAQRPPYDEANQRYDYPHLHETYHMGLAVILGEKLLASGTLSELDQRDVLQHVNSMRSHLLDQQQEKNGKKIAWVTGINSPHSLINTETTAIVSLALGANASQTFQAGESPLKTGTGFFKRPYGVLSAVEGLPPAGKWVDGATGTLAAGAHEVAVDLRAPNPQNIRGRVEVYNLATGAVLNRVDLDAQTLNPGNEWSRVKVPFNVGSPQTVGFRVVWNSGNLDASTIRVS